MTEEGAQRRPLLGVIGLGQVGKALKHVLGFEQEVVGYDLKLPHPWELVLATDIVFVCVQTPGGNNGRLDCSQVDQVLSRLQGDGYQGVVAVRSTVGVGYMDGARTRFPSLRLVYLPEFLRERSRLSWTANPDRIVIAGDDEDVKIVLSALSGIIEDAPILRMSYRDAEIGKLAHNAFIATKVSFTNEVEQICVEQGADPDQVMSVVTADRRVRSKEHLRPGLGPYDGRCVPKDTSELSSVAKDPVLLPAVQEVNRRATVRFRQVSSVHGRQGRATPTPIAHEAER
jgi:UDPglucose 6-dehydrogenase